MGYKREKLIRGPQIPYAYVKFSEGKFYLCIDMLCSCLLLYAVFEIKLGDRILGSCWATSLGLSNVLGSVHEASFMKEDILLMR